jgi:hypothetical protein
LLNYKKVLGAESPAFALIERAGAWHEALALSFDAVALPGADQPPPDQPASPRPWLS